MSEDARPARRHWLRRHPLITAGSAVVVVGGAAAGLFFGLNGDPAASANMTTTTTTVTTGTIQQSVSASGTLAPKSQKQLNFAVAGTVTRVWAHEGDHVRKGQRLARIDSASLAATVAQAKATVASDRANVHDDKTNDAGKTQLQADRSALTAARNQLASARKQLSDATLRSPITGLVASVDLNVGDAVSSSSASDSDSSSSSSSLPGLDTSSSTSDAQVLVISTKRWKVSATVDATQVGLIKAGDQAQLSVTGSSDTVYGTIASVGLVSSSTSGTASYPVVIDVTGTKGGLHDGASVTATLIYKKLTNVVTISATALHRNTSGSRYVEQVKNGSVVHTPVTLGITSGTQVQIKSGLSAGDKIVVPESPFTRTGTTGGGTTGSQPRSGILPSFPGGGQFPGGGVFPGGGAVGGS